MNRSRLILAPFAAVVVLLAGSPAYAASWAHNDVRRDVIVMTCPEGAESEEECTEEVKPAVTIPDITRVGVVHTADRVVVRIRQVRLGYAQNRIHSLRIVTNEGIARDVFALAFAGSRQPDYFEVGRPSGTTVNCPRLSARYDYVRDMTTFSIPRRCLSDPRWIRVGAMAITFDDSETTFHGDDALRNGVMTGVPALSPRIARG